jgi:hypothetical protein
VGGGVTTVGVGKPSSNWEVAGCYTDKATFDRVSELFAYAASLFDLIMIDDFFFTECECEECVAARGGRSWSAYRRELMLRLARDRVLDAAHRVNPNARVIIKFPQWYEIYHHRGYDVATEPEIFDLVWAGTETRDYEHEEDLPHVAQYQGYFVMRWIGGIGGAKCGGGWFDTYATSPPTYLEQATQTILGGAREALLFSYRAFNGRSERGTEDVAALTAELPAMFRLAELVNGRAPRGIVAPKPPNSHCGPDAYVFDWAGMLGLPLVPATEIPLDAPAVLLAAHILDDPTHAEKLDILIANGARVLMTTALAGQLDARIRESTGVQVLDIGRSPTQLRALTREQLREVRRPLLAHLGLEVDAPPMVALYPFDDDVLAVDNFNDEEVKVTLSGSAAHGMRPVLSIPSAVMVTCEASGDVLEMSLPPRTLAVFQK